MLQVYVTFFGTPLCGHHQSHVRYPTDIQFLGIFLQTESTVTVSIASIIRCCKSLMSLWWVGDVQLAFCHTCASSFAVL